MPCQGWASEVDRRVDSWAQDSFVVGVVVVVIVLGEEEADVRRGDEVRVVRAAPMAGQVDAYRGRDRPLDG